MDDTLLKSNPRTIPREDVAELCVQCLGLPAASNRSFDVISAKPEDSQPTTDFAGLLTEMSASCDYSINSQM